MLHTNDDTGAIDVAFKPGDPRVVYAALWQTRRPPWNVYPPSSGPGSGLYKSVDGGLTWAPMTNGLPTAMGRAGFAVSPAAPKRVYALVDAKTGGGLYRSDDEGASWTRVGGRPADHQPRLVLRRAHRQSGERRRAVGVRHHRAALHRRRPHVDPSEGRSHRRRLPPPVDRPARSEAAHPGLRPGGAGHAERRGDVVELVQPAHRPVLSRDHRQPLSLPRLRRPAGQRRGGHPEPHRQRRRDQPHPLPRKRGGRGERQHRARSGRSRHHLRRPRRQARPAHQPGPIGRSDAGGARRVPRHLDPAAHLLRRRQDALLRQPAAVGDARRRRTTGTRSAPTSPARPRPRRRPSMRPPSPTTSTRRRARA